MPPTSANQSVTITTQDGSKLEGTLVSSQPITCYSSQAVGAVAIQTANSTSPVFGILTAGQDLGCSQSSMTTVNGTSSSSISASSDTAAASAATESSGLAEQLSSIPVGPTVEDTQQSNAAAPDQPGPEHSC